MAALYWATASVASEHLDTTSTLTNPNPRTLIFTSCEPLKASESPWKPLEVLGNPWNT